MTYREWLTGSILQGELIWSILQGGLIWSSLQGVAYRECLTRSYNCACYSMEPKVTTGRHSLLIAAHCIVQVLLLAAFSKNLAHLQEYNEDRGFLIFDA